MKLTFFYWTFKKKDLNWIMFCLTSPGPFRDHIKIEKLVSGESVRLVESLVVGGHHSKGHFWLEALHRPNLSSLTAHAGEGRRLPTCHPSSASRHFCGPATPSRRVPPTFPRRGPTSGLPAETPAEPAPWGTRKRTRRGT